MDNLNSCVIPPLYILIGGSVIAIATVIAWVSIWKVLKEKNESIKELLSESAFVQNLTIYCVVFTSGILGLAGIMKGELIGSILSGIVGYVLGTIKTK